MRFLICGIGSIGQRHYKNLQTLGHELAIFRSRRNGGPFIKNFLQSQKKENRPVKIFFNLEQALTAFKPDAVFVTNPTSQHLKTALAAARTGCHIFIEKPISHNLNGLLQLQKLAKQKRLKIMIGYNFRFNPLLSRMKRLFAAGAIGSPLSAGAIAGANVADWHPWEDYRQSYAVNKSGGGGVVLNFSHDIDYLYWFLGRPNKISAVGGKLTPLQGDMEDMIKALLRFPNGAIASLHLDYWQRPPVRTFELIGTKGKLNWDYEAGTLIFQPLLRSGKRRMFKVPAGFERNDMYLNEVKHFIDAIKKNTEPLITLKQSINVLRVALRIKRSLG